MDPLEKLGEQRIAEAIASGEFDGLAGLGHPVELEDLSQVDPELRGATSC